MLKYILVLSIVFLFITGAKQVFSSEIKFYSHVYVNSMGKPVGEQPYQKDLGNYLYSLKNQDLVRARFRDNNIYEFDSRFLSFYVVYNDNGTVRELNETNYQHKSISHFYKYSKDGYVREIDRYHVTDTKSKSKLSNKTSSIFSYNKNKQVLKVVKKNNSNIITGETTYLYNAQGKKIQKLIVENGRVLYKFIYSYNKQGNLLYKKVLGKGKTLISITRYYYNRQGKLIRIEPRVYKVKYYIDRKKKISDIRPLKKGVVRGMLEFNDQKEIIGVKGLLPNVQSYIEYHMTIQSHPKVKLAIHSLFKNRSIKNSRILNTVKIIQATNGRELKTEWLNHKGEEIWSKIPGEIRFMKYFNLSNLLNTEYVIVGKVLRENKSKVTQEIIVELYDIRNRMSWCHFGNGHFFHIVKFNDKVKRYKKVRILKAGYRYETINFRMARGKTLLLLPNTQLNIAAINR